MDRRRKGCHEFNALLERIYGAFFVTTYTVLHPPNTREAKKHIEYGGIADVDFSSVFEKLNAAGNGV